MSNQHSETHTHAGGPMVKPHEGAACRHFPEFTRLKYFYGQMLGQNDFQTEQDYFREKLKLHNLCLHGYGTVCGLEVVPVPMRQDCDHPSHDQRSKLEAALKEAEQKIKEHEKTPVKKGDEHNHAKKLEDYRAAAEVIRRKLETLHGHKCDEDEPTRVQIECGFALDCYGNELIVRQPLVVDLWQSLSSDDRKRLDDDGQTLYVSICYCAVPVDPVRPVLMDTCGGSPECVYGKLRDSLRVSVTLEKPKTDERCETCCGTCGGACLLLAEISKFKQGEALAREQIDNGVRRMVGPYSPVTITGISWTHGGEYTPDEAKELLRGKDKDKDKKGGIKIQFSRPVRTDTLVRGVFDVWVIESGPGRSGNIYNMEGAIDFPNTATTDWVKFRQLTRESLQEGDRLLIILRTSFILDKCCHAVDGDHLGGRIPLLPEYEKFRRGEPHKDCGYPPQRTVPWTSGNGTGGGTFESWFYIKTEAGSEEEEEYS